MSYLPDTIDLQADNKALIKSNRRIKFTYREFIESKFWQIQKEVWYSKHKKKCARCKADKYINLHHKKYPKVGRFLTLKDNDFVALCRSCHFLYHKRHGVQQNMQTHSNRFVKKRQ